MSKKYFKVIETQEYIVEDDTLQEAVEAVEYKGDKVDHGQEVYELTDKDLEKYGIN